MKESLAEVPLGITLEPAGDGASIPALSDDSITAGETVHVNGLISASCAPVNQLSDKAITDLVVFLRLPQGVSVSNIQLARVTGSRADAVYFSDGFERVRDMTGTPKTESLSAADYEVGDPIDLAEGYTLRVITFKNGAGRVGWFDDDLGQHQVRLAFDLSFGAALPSTSFDLCKHVFVKSASLNLYASTEYPARSVTEDTFGVLAAAFGEEAAAKTNGKLGTFASTYSARYLTVKAARGGNKPTVSFGVNGGTAANGMEPLLLVSENGDVALPVAPVKKGKDFLGWACSDGNVYQAGEKLKAGEGNLSLAAWWSGEPRPAPDAARPFEFTVNESGVNYGGSAADPNADATGKVPEKVARRAALAAAGIVPGPGDYDPEPGAGASAGAGAGASAGSGTAATAGATAATSLAKPPATKISKLKAAKKAFTVKWAKKSKKKVDGYQVRYSLKKNMKSAKTKTVKGAAKASLTVKKLKAGKKYYVQVRTYKKVGKKTVYSAWSAKKAVKVKK